MRRIFLLLLCSVPPVGAADLFGDRVAGKNSQGNQLYLQGKFADAERAYLEAQGIAPGRPELLYNHGNALIKQKKVEPGLQQLRQAAAKGTQGLQANAWYNSGNALFEAGNFQEAVQAYIQALRRNPSDRDAKHNLELALKRLQQQQQKQDDQKGQSGKKDGEQQKQDQAGKPQEQKGPAQSSASGQQPPREPARQRPQQQDGSLSRDQALQILDALQNQELTEQKKRLLRLEQRRAPGKDW